MPSETVSMGGRSVTRWSSIRRCRVAPAPLAFEVMLPDRRSYGILGEHRPGTLAEYVTLPARNVVAKPAALPWDQAAAYGLATGTAYRMLRRSRLGAGDVLLVVGVGGGVSSMSLLLDLAMGADVYVTSTSGQKIARAVELGAKGGFDSTAEFAKDLEEDHWSGCRRGHRERGSGNMEPVGAEPRRRRAFGDLWFDERAQGGDHRAVSVLQAAGDHRVDDVRLRRVRQGDRVDRFRQGSGAGRLGDPLRGSAFRPGPFGGRCPARQSGHRPLNRIAGPRSCRYCRPRQ